MIKVDETKLVEVIKDAINEGFNVGNYDLEDVREYLYQIIQQDTLEMDDEDLNTLFIAVQDYFDKGEQR